MTDDAEIQRHREDWGSFVKLTIRSTALVIAILILMAVFLV